MYLVIQVRFSDEKRFMVFWDGPVRVWRRKDQKFKAGYTRGTSKSRVGVMVWMAIAADGRSRLLRCPDRMNSTEYQNEILTPSLNFIRHRNPSLRDSIVYMQDGASCHTSRSTEAYLQAHRVNVLAPWPANSPDLNPVEHCWSWLAGRLVGQRFTNSDQLWDALQREWDQRPQTLIPKLYGSMVRRMTAVQLAKGGNTKY